ncbi:MAG: hypothetical protein IJV98_00395 [Clostridia bacterium]|nr:hypothetical protein [Clostridia bacterium]
MPFTLIGCIAALVLVLTGRRPRKWGYCYYFELGERWGGCNLGIFFLKDACDSAMLKSHEHGHAVQNCIFGPLMIPLIAIPSLIRSRYRDHLITRKKRDPRTLPPYDSIWFEGQATRLGNKLVNELHARKQRA